MSKIFYDQIIILDKVEKAINQIADSHQEKLELWQIIDNITHHHIINCILNLLPETHHLKFLNLFHKSPHDDQLFLFLKENSDLDIKSELQKESQNLSFDLLELINS